MDFSNESFRFPWSKEPESDTKREELLAKQRVYALGMAWLLVTLGVIELLSNGKHPAPSPLLTAQSITSVLVVGILLGAFQLSKYNLEPKDEYEIQTRSSSRASAYNFLSFAILMLIILGGHLHGQSLSGVLLIVLGVSYLILKRDSKSAKSAKK